MRLYTRSGDQGTTYCAALGKRVSKSHPLIELVGTLDEAESALGLAQSLLPDGLDDIARDLEWAQNLLFRVGFTIAGRKCVSEDDVRVLEEMSDRYSRNLEPLFVLHGGHPSSAACSLARSIVRRAERTLVGVLESGVEMPEGGLLLKTLNRLSDALYAVSQALNKRLGKTPNRASCES